MHGLIRGKYQFLDKKKLPQELHNRLSAAGRKITYAIFLLVHAAWVLNPLAGIKYSIYCKKNLTKY
jgi:hypothetical protein